MRHCSGMTLVECCVVIALVAFLSALGFHFFTMQSKSLIRFELEKLYGAIVYMQRKAIVSGKEQYIVIEPDKRRYLVEGKAKPFASGVVCNFLSHVLGPPAQPVYEIKNSVTFKDNTIVCYPDGIVSAGSIYLTDRRSRFLFAITSGVVPTLYLRMYGYDIKHKKWYLLGNSKK